MAKLYTVAEMVAAERAADAAGHSYAQMMEIAGRAVAEAVQERRDISGKSVFILVGPGNNGGDGLVAGRYLAEAGADVAFYLYKPRDPAADDNFARIQEKGLMALTAEFDQRYRVLRTRLSITDVLIDALLGTGVSRPIGGGLAELFKQVRAGLENPPEGASRPFITAVDCPSGLNCDNGALDPLAIPADLTVTFAGAKRGHILFPGAGAVGELVVADIGIDPELPAVRGVQTAVATPEAMRDLLPPRPLDGHKGTFGKLLIAGGCAVYRGAPLLAARSAFRAGAGLVHLAVPDPVRDAAVLALPEATSLPMETHDLLTADSAQRLLNALPAYDAVCLGPGLGAAETFAHTFFPALPDDTPPLLIDADGLNQLAQLPDWPNLLPKNCVLTPHPGEMARLMNISGAELKTMNRIEVARAQAQDWGVTLLLKGAYTVVAGADGRLTVIPFAAPVLAVGGSGDVLSGLITALLGQELAPYEAAVLGAWLHGWIGANALYDRGLLASEIADRIPTAMAAVQTG